MPHAREYTARPMSRQNACRLFVAAMVASLPAAASAQTEDADPVAAEVEAGRAAAEAEAMQHFEVGRVSFAEGRNEIALQEFEAAYALSGRPALLYNIGLVHDRLRNDREALASFEQYLADVPGAENRVSVEARIRVLRVEIEREDALARAAAVADDEPGEEVWESPVFWTLLAVGIVGVGVGVGVGIGLSQDPGTAPVVPGPSGVVIEALSF